MTNVNWKHEVESRQDAMLEDLKDLLRIRSVRDDAKAVAGAPFGPGPKEALDFMMAMGQKDGFETKVVEDVAGHIEFGQGEEIVGILGHVDVVPEGDGWDSAPYEPEMRDGKLFARGVSDDKGPTIAAYYGMKIIKELKLPVSKRIRLFIGSDEESGMSCLKTYLEKEEMPTIAFAPDAEFPIINTEKGISSVDVSFENKVLAEKCEFELAEFISGERYNMVAADAKATLNKVGDTAAMVASFNKYIEDNNVEGNIVAENDIVKIQVIGKSAHAMEPRNGVNAGLALLEFLSGYDITGSANDFVSFAMKYLYEDSRAEHFGIAAEDESGDLTMNVGLLSFNKDGGKFGLNFRYPYTFDMTEAKNTIAEKALAFNGKITLFEDEKPSHVDGDSFLVSTLAKVYEKQTGAKSELLSIGGGTYARYLKEAVAFGAAFPGAADTMHQKNEYSVWEDLVRASVIYAEAIYELAK